jgi:hypothetical protein
MKTLSGSTSRQRRARRRGLLLTTALALWTLGVPRAQAQEAAAPNRLQVGQDGLELYPRWNKLFPPLARLEAGALLEVLRDRGNWKQVNVSSISTQGWAFCQAAPPPAGASPLSLPLAASPTTSGLVTKGWSPATRAGTRDELDFARVDRLLHRTLDHGAYLAFLAEDPPPGDRVAAPVAAKPEREPAKPWETGPAAALEALERATGRTPSETERQLRQKSAALGRERLQVPLAESLDEADEIALGRAAAARILHDTPVVEDGPISTYVACVGMRLVEQLPADRSAWHFAVLDTDAVNAFSVPGGLVFLTRGAFESCSNEAQVAALLAHEIAHVILRHAVISLDKDLLEVLRDAARREMDELLKTDEATRQLIEELERVGDDLYAMSQAPFRQGLEIEADREAVFLLAAAGYDPREGLALLRRLAGRERDASLLGSHPPVRVRVEVVEKALEEVPAAGSVGLERFLRVRMNRPAERDKDR